MSFFNELGRKTSEATTKITRETKLRLKMNENKGRIRNTYEEIGKKVYEKNIQNEVINVKEDLKEEFEKINKLAEEIEEAKLEILKLNNKKQCPRCLAEVDKTFAYCSRCGEKLDFQEEEKEEKKETPAENEEEKAPTVVNEETSVEQSADNVDNDETKKDEE